MSVMSTTNLTLSIAKEFSETPGARYISDGDYSGELFYNTILKPAFETVLNSNKKLIIDLDGTQGYATSFLDEAFGRLSQEFSERKVLEKVDFISTEEPYLKNEIKEYINEALSGRYSNAS